MHMTPYGRFALAGPDVVCNQKCFMITGQNLSYLCAILNSSLITWFVKRTAVTTGMGLSQWDKFTVERVPIVHPSQSTMDDCRDHVSLLLAAIDAGKSEVTRDIYNTLDAMVFDFYGLTSKKINMLKHKAH